MHFFLKPLVYWSLDLRSIMPRFVLHTFLLRLPSIQNAWCPVIVTGGMRLTTKSNEVDAEKIAADVQKTFPQPIVYCCLRMMILTIL